MKNRLHRQIKKYVKEISLSIPNDYPGREQILHAIEQNLAQYASEHPYSSFDNMIKEFGSAPEVSASFMEELSGMDAALSLQNKTRFNRIVLALCIAIIVTIFILGCKMYYISFVNTKLPIKEQTYYYNGKKVSYEEFQKLNLK